MTDTIYKCNTPSCSKPLLKQAFVTSCSHMYCCEHGQKILKSRRVCTVCGANLASTKYSICLIDLNPPEEFKSQLLCGYTPDIIMDIASHGLNFYTSQVYTQNVRKDSLIKDVQRRAEEAFMLEKQNFQIELYKAAKRAEALQLELEKKINEIDLQQQKILNLMQDKQQLAQRLESYKRNVKKNMSECSVPTTNYNAYSRDANMFW